MFDEQRIRAFLFYLSVLIFLAGLPFILSFSLGYKFDHRKFKFTKTGIIVLKTQPPGADVYFNDTLLGEKTPATINEVMPGEYRVRIEYKDYYPWEAGVVVEPRKVSRLDKIILFPLRPDIKQLNKNRFSSFWIDQKNKVIYYINQEDSSIYKSDTSGQHFEIIGVLPELRPPSLEFKLSNDRGKLVYFNKHQIAVSILNAPESQDFPDPYQVLDYPEDVITNLFWHSDDYHLIIVTQKKILAMEAKPGALPVTLVNLNKKNIPASYDADTDTLYFIDYQKAGDGNFYNNLYKLEINTKAFLFLQEFMKKKPNEEEPKN